MAKTRILTFLENCTKREMSRKLAMLRCGAEMWHPPCMAIAKCTGPSSVWMNITIELCNGSAAKCVERPGRERLQHA